MVILKCKCKHSQYEINLTSQYTQVEHRAKSRSQQASFVTLQPDNLQTHKEKMKISVTLEPTTKAC